MSDIVRYRGDTRTMHATFTQEDGTPYDLTDCELVLTVASHQNPAAGYTPTFAVIATITDEASGKAAFDFTSDQVDILGIYWYDIELTDAAGKVSTLRKGRWLSKHDISRGPITRVVTFDADGQVDGAPPPLDELRPHYIEPTWPDFEYTTAKAAIGKTSCLKILDDPVIGWASNMRLLSLSRATMQVDPYGVENITYQGLIAFHATTSVYTLIGMTAGWDGYWSDLLNIYIPYYGANANKRGIYTYMDDGGGGYFYEGPYVSLLNCDITGQQFFNFKLVYTDANIFYAKFWQDGDAEPSAWDVDAFDHGALMPFRTRINGFRLAAQNIWIQNLSITFEVPQ